MSLEIRLISARSLNLLGKVLALESQNLEDGGCWKTTSLEASLRESNGWRR